MSDKCPCPAEDAVTWCMDFTPLSHLAPPSFSKTSQAGDMAQWIEALVTNPK